MNAVGFAWPGLPDYAARCIRAVVESRKSEVTVIATRPSVPIEGMERSLGQQVTWLDETQTPSSWSSLGANVPKVLFCGGYSTRAFAPLAREVRECGGKVILMSDHNWEPKWLPMIARSTSHRLIRRRKFDGIFVPGASGVKLAKSWGYQIGSITTGLYGADPSLFRGGPPLDARPKTFLFIGQFIDRKNVRGLAKAFVQIADQIPDWTLILCGSGPQEHQLPEHPRLQQKGFLQPMELATMLRQARCLVLPSKEEHWGLVVHEATLTGCALALSRAVGSAHDLARKENAVLFPAGDVLEISRALVEIAKWNLDSWSEAEKTSRKLASRFGPRQFAVSVNEILEQFATAAMD